MLPADAQAMPLSSPMSSPPARKSQAKRPKKAIVVSSDDDDDKEDSFKIKNQRTKSEFFHTSASTSASRNPMPQTKTMTIEIVSSEPEIIEMHPSSQHIESPSSDDSESLNNALLISFFNAASTSDLQDTLQCSKDQATLIEALRPLEWDTLIKRLNKTKGVSGKMVDTYFQVNDMYEALDALVDKCAHISDKLMVDIQSWFDHTGIDDGSSTAANDPTAGLHFASFERGPGSAVIKQKDFLTTQPAIVNPNMKLKDYQLMGISWLLLLNSHNISCILADEMGLGKTAQIISFLGALKERGNNGPHLVVVPSSTGENWLRECKKWCPSMRVEYYYGAQSERFHIRERLGQQSSQFDIMVTSYNMVSGSKEDRSFLRRRNFQYMILDEGHLVKNVTSQRYKHLMSIQTPYRILLTGTPLQNNLQELMALLMFIMPDLFGDNEQLLRKVFSLKTTDASNSRIQKARLMMTPFILRRRKAQVMKELPAKEQEVIHCEMTEFQKLVYRNLLAESRKTFAGEGKSFKDPIEIGATSGSKKKNATAKAKKSTNDGVRVLNNILMQLRKAACHPMLQRRTYDDAELRRMSKLILKEEPYWDSQISLVYEDMTHMSDLELHRLCVDNKSLRAHQRDISSLTDSAKIQVLVKDILPKHFKQGDRLLIFSQFTMMLDLLELVFKHFKYTYIRMDGQTPVQERQILIDQYQNDEGIFIFLLSTKAGGFGINLTAANVVIIHDLDFNPHNDAQAEDRSHRGNQVYI